MPLGDIAAGILEILGRIIGQIIFEIFFELLIKGPGYFIAKKLFKAKEDPDGLLVFTVGIIFWVIIGFGIFFIYKNISGV